MPNEFTFNDLTDWLNCSDDAGKKVWFESEFYKAMTYKAMGKVGKRYYDRVYKIWKKGESPFNLSSSTEKETLPPKKIMVSAFGVEEEAFTIIVEVATEIKKNKELKFTDCGQFIGYVETVVPRRLAGLLINRGRLVEPPPVDEEDEPEAHEPVDDTIYEILEKFIQQKEVNKYTIQVNLMMETFKNYLSSALKDRLDLLLKCSVGLGWFGVLVFLEKKLIKERFNQTAQEILQDVFNQHTWNGNNRRLRAAWRSFLESREGREHNYNLKECRQWLDQIF